MVTRDKRVDAYIEKAPEFAQPILRHVRGVIHEACPDVVETIKWGMPSYEYHGILCGFAAFKAHCVFGFWKHELVVGAHDDTSRTGMGSFGRMTQMSDLPSKTVLAKLVKKAMKLNEDGVKVVRKKTTQDKKPVAMPQELADALALPKNKKARATFDAFSPSHKKEYMEWIGEAKREETRARRLEQALEWLAQGKPRNWKYMNC